MNNIINYLIIDKIKYKNTNTKQLDKFIQFIDNKTLFNLSINYFKNQYTIYNDPVHFLRPTTVFTNKDKLKFDVINNTPFVIKDTSILKTKLITLNYPLYFFILYNYISPNISKTDNILIVSKNYGLVEFMIYNNFINFDHLYYKVKYNFLDKIIRKVKKEYTFNNYKYGKKLKKKYKFMIFDLIIINIYDVDVKNYTEFKRILKTKEASNLILLKRLYNYLDNLELGGNIIFLVGLYFREETLLIIEHIFKCF